MLSRLWLSSFSCTRLYMTFILEWVSVMLLTVHWSLHYALHFQIVKHVYYIRILKFVGWRRRAEKSLKLSSYLKLDWYLKCFVLYFHCCKDQWFRPNFSFFFFFFEFLLKHVYFRTETCHWFVDILLQVFAKFRGLVLQLLKII